MTVTVVTGGAAGLGAAMARAFAGRGDRVAILDRNADAALATAKALKQEFATETLAVPVDVASQPSVASAAELVKDHFGSVNVLCSNVGVQQFGSIETVTDDEWRWVLDVNVIGTARVVRAFLPLIRSSDGPRHVVVTSSSSALVPTVRLGAYQASKAAVAVLAETLRLELEPDKINVLTIFPAGMSTEHLDSSNAARPADLQGQSSLSEDLMAMLAYSPDLANEVISPDEAARNLLRDLDHAEPYLVTHGHFGDNLDAGFALLKAAYLRGQA